MTSRTLWAVILFSVVAACQSRGSTTGVVDGDTPPGTDVFTLVLLRAVDHLPNDLDRGEVVEAYRAHRAALDHDLREGKLLLTGPVLLDEHAGEDASRSGADQMRGLLVFDGSSMDAVVARVEADQAVRLGLFQPEFLPLLTLDVIRQVPARVVARKVASVTPERSDLRSYTVVIAEDGAAAVPAFRSAVFANQLVLLGQLGPPMDGALFVILDVAEPSQVRARAAVVSAPTEGWTILRWLTSPALSDVITEITVRP